jgi:hypothetical protein
LFLAIGKTVPGNGSLGNTMLSIKTTGCFLSKISIYKNCGINNGATQWNIKTVNRQVKVIAENFWLLVFGFLNFEISFPLVRAASSYLIEAAC